jgi:hypothetical protein
MAVCNENWLEGRKYGNEVECGCTALGKYRIGNSYNGRFGQAFKLYGLERTNDKAFERFVVLHSHECVPETEVRVRSAKVMDAPLYHGFSSTTKTNDYFIKEAVLLGSMNKTRFFSRHNLPAFFLGMHSLGKRGLRVIFVLNSLLIGQLALASATHSGTLPRQYWGPQPLLRDDFL